VSGLVEGQATVAHLSLFLRVRFPLSTEERSASLPRCCSFSPSHFQFSVKVFALVLSLPSCPYHLSLASSTVAFSFHLPSQTLDDTSNSTCRPLSSLSHSRTLFSPSKHCVFSATWERGPSPCTRTTNLGLTLPGHPTRLLTNWLPQ
jgi:hypothetical protein